MRTIFTSLALLALAADAAGDYTFPSFDVVAGFEPATVVLDTSAVPPGDYASYSVTLTFNFDASQPFTEEAVWELASPANPFLLAAPGPSPDGTDATATKVLTWSGPLTQTYHGGDPLELRVQQLQRDTQSAWTGVSLTLHSGVVPPAMPPDALDLGDVGAGWRIGATHLDSNGVAWFKFTTPAVTTSGCAVLRIETAGSDLAGGVYRHGNDTEMALYTSTGLRVATGDDVDMLGGALNAALSFGVDEGAPVVSAGDLPAGEYYLAVAGFDAAFDIGWFGVAPNSAVEGTLRIAVRFGEPVFDCDRNGRADACDIAGGSSADADTNGRPDECDDCNANGVLDSVDIATGAAGDCDGNGVPDSCDAQTKDCDFNGVYDACEIAAGTSADCNRNGVPDACDLGRGYSPDCNGNGVPDECDFGGRTLFAVEKTASRTSVFIGRSSWQPPDFWVSYVMDEQGQSPVPPLGLAIEPGPGGRFLLLGQADGAVTCNGGRILIEFEPRLIVSPIRRVVALDECVDGVAFAGDGELFGIVGSEGDLPAGSIVAIDPETGATTPTSVPVCPLPLSSPYTFSIHPRTHDIFRICPTDVDTNAAEVQQVDWVTAAVEDRFPVQSSFSRVVAFDEQDTDVLLIVEEERLKRLSWIRRTLTSLGGGVTAAGFAFDRPAFDCNANGVPDECEAVADLGSDFDSDGLPDACDSDVDNDGVPNSFDVCGDSPPGRLTNENGGSRGDRDDSCTVDLVDFEFFPGCLDVSGPGRTFGSSLGCPAYFDFDRDRDVDLADFSRFQQVFGP